MLSVSSLLVGHLYTFGKLSNSSPLPIFKLRCLLLVVYIFLFYKNGDMFANNLFINYSFCLTVSLKQKFMSSYILILHGIIFNGCMVSHWTNVKYHKWSSSFHVLGHLCHFWFFTVLNKAKMTTLSFYPYLCAHDYFVSKSIPQNEIAETKHEPNLGDFSKLS